jgi:transposase
MIGLDVAESVRQAHGAATGGAVVFRGRLSRARLLNFMTTQAPCTVAMEACASAHHWGRAIGDLGHDVRLIPPADVKPS